jgi:hypothetical protein
MTDDPMQAKTARAMRTRFMLLAFKNDVMFIGNPPLP